MRIGHPFFSFSILLAGLSLLPAFAFGATQETCRAFGFYFDSPINPAHHASVMKYYSGRIEATTGSTKEYYEDIVDGILDCIRLQKENGSAKKPDKLSEDRYERILSQLVAQPLRKNIDDPLFRFEPLVVDRGMNKEWLIEKYGAQLRADLKRENPEHFKPNGEPINEEARKAFEKDFEEIIEENARPLERVTESDAELFYFLEHIERRFNRESYVAFRNQLSHAVGEEVAKAWKKDGDLTGDVLKAVIEAINVFRPTVIATVKKLSEKSVDLRALEWIFDRKEIYNYFVYDQLFLKEIPNLVIRSLAHEIEKADAATLTRRLGKLNDFPKLLKTIEWEIQRSAQTTEFRIPIPFGGYRNNEVTKTERFGYAKIAVDYPPMQNLEKAPQEEKMACYAVENFREWIEELNWFTSRTDKDHLFKTVVRRAQNLKDLSAVLVPIQSESLSLGWEVKKFSRPLFSLLDELLLKENLNDVLNLVRSGKSLDGHVLDGRLWVRLTEDAVYAAIDGRVTNEIIDAAARLFAGWTWMTYLDFVQVNSYPRMRRGTFLHHLTPEQKNRFESQLKVAYLESCFRGMTAPIRAAVNLVSGK